nr:hypothetical transcript [Hymenolepis microstoma]
MYVGFRTPQLLTRKTIMYKLGAVNKVTNHHVSSTKAPFETLPWEIARPSCLRFQDRVVKSIMGNPRKNMQKSSFQTTARRTLANSSSALDKIAIEQIHHISFPHIPIQGALSFHITRLIFSIIALCLQFLNIYRTVWWLGRPGVKYPIIWGFIQTAENINLSHER